MIDFLTNSKEYEIQANGQLTSILSQFDSDYVMHIIADTIENQFQRFDTLPKPNAVESFEQIFKQLFDMYQFDSDNILATRVEAYQSIIHILKSKFDFEFRETDDMDWFTVTKYLYDFFISNFNNYLVNFYVRYIMNEKDNIYSSMNLEELKKQKDVSSIYGRYAFSDSESLAVIAANLPLVLSNLKNIDIPDSVIYRYAYGNTEPILDMFMSHIRPNNSLFQLYNSLLFNEYLYPNIITQVRLKLQMENKAEFDTIRASQLKKIED